MGKKMIYWAPIIRNCFEFVHTLFLTVLLVIFASLIGCVAPTTRPLSMTKMPQKSR